MTDVVALATELLAIPSTTREEGPAAEFVAGWLRARGWTVTMQEVTPGRSNVWAMRQGGGVTLSTHLDTVPPYIAPTLVGNHLRGRGSCDAKGIAAAMMTAAQNLAERGEERVDLLFVVGEERGSDGAAAANRLPATSQYLINGEPSESILASGCKGAMRLVVRTAGRPAHSAYPQLGESAILPMAHLIAELETLSLPIDPILGATTVNVGTIRGGVAPNVIPDACEAEVLVRLVGDAAPVRAALAAWAADRATLDYGLCIPAMHFHTVPGFEAKPVSYTSDIPLLTNWGTPLLFGPGSIHVAHTAEEFVAVDELRASVTTYERLAQSLLAEIAWYV
jgi:acetylornithine deacetylase